VSSGRDELMSLWQMLRPRARKLLLLETSSEDAAAGFEAIAAGVCSFVAAAGVCH